MLLDQVLFQPGQNGSRFGEGQPERLRLQESALHAYDLPNRFHLPFVCLHRDLNRNLHATSTYGPAWPWYGDPAKASVGADRFAGNVSGSGQWPEGINGRQGPLTFDAGRWRPMGSRPLSPWFFLASYFTLTETDLQEVAVCSGVINKLGFAVV
ncbi:MAG: hypothetical protein JO069_04420 [Verrucomicrobia bacterium]|nr:hypothetical protein [Verrucomicrobiota bacterium]